MRTNKEATDWARGGKDCKVHAVCMVHPVRRACGHVDELHFTDRCSFWRRLKVYRSVPCGECQALATFGFVILDNHFHSTKEAVIGW